MEVLDLGKIRYSEAWEVQRGLFQLRLRGRIDDTLILVEHHPTITFGQSEKWNVLRVPIETLKEKGVDFHKSERGGGAAYLGPGQLIGYPIMNITPYGGILSFMRKLEEVMIRTAADFNVKVERHDTMNPTTDKPYRATWYKNNGDAYLLCTKGVGIKVHNGGMYTHHGFSLNVYNHQQNYFHFIDPCGFPIDQVKPISMEEIVGRNISIQEVKKSVVKNFKEVFK